MTKIVIKQLPKLKNHNKPAYCADFASRQTISTDEVAEAIQKNCTLKKSDIEAVITELGEYIMKEMAEGNSVKLNNLGIFTPMLKLGGVREIAADEGRNTYLRGENVHIDKVRFTMQKSLLDRANAALKPTRSTDDGVVEMGKVSGDEAERKEMVRQFLAENNIMSVKDYMSLTGMRRTHASTELRRWCEGDAPLLRQLEGMRQLLFVLA